MQIGVDVVGDPEFEPDHIDIDAPPPQKGTTVEIGAQRFTVQELILRQPTGGGAHYIARLADEALPDRLCSTIVRRQTSLARILNDPSLKAAVGRRELYGEIHGLRVALCLVMGWDPDTEADKEGRADQYVQQWHDRRF